MLENDKSAKPVNKNRILRKATFGSVNRHAYNQSSSVLD